MWPKGRGRAGSLEQFRFHLLLPVKKPLFLSVLNRMGEFFTICCPWNGEFGVRREWEDCRIQSSHIGLCQRIQAGRNNPLQYEVCWQTGEGSFQQLRALEVVATRPGFQERNSAVLAFSAQKQGQTWGRGTNLRYPDMRTEQTWERFLCWFLFLWLEDRTRLCRMPAQEVRRTK